MHPYSVISNCNAAKLYKLKDARFQIISKGDLFPFLQGYDYILVESELSDFLESLNIPQIEFKDAIIWNSEINEENKDFKELIVKNKLLYSENFKDIDLKGLQMYLYNQQNLFVSRKLKETLEKSKFNYLSFGEGWSGFAT